MLTIAPRTLSQSSPEMETSCIGAKNTFQKVHGSAGGHTNEPSPLQSLLWISVLCAHYDQQD